MYIEAIKYKDGYLIPIDGKKSKIKVYLEEDIENLDLSSLLDKLPQKKSSKEISKEEFMEKYGDELYRKYLLLDKRTMEDNWEYLVRTKTDFGDGFEFMENAVSNWSKE